MALQMGNDERIVIRQLARRRLTGAAVLLAGAAIILPLVLDSGPRPAATQPVVHQTGQVAVNLQAQPPVVTMPAHSPQPVESVPAVPAVAKPERVPQGPSADSRPADRKATVAASLPVVHAVARQPQPVPAHHEKLAERQAIGTSADTTLLRKGDDAEAIHADKPAAKAPVHGRTFAVQLGVFSHVANADDLCKRVQSQGLVCHSEHLPSGARRLRVGPYASHTEAEQVLVRLKLADITGQIVPVAP